MTGSRNGGKDFTVVAATLATQVRSLEDSHQQIAQALEGLRETMSENYTTLSKQINERSKTQWSTIFAAGSLVVAVISAIGFLAYMPINARQETIESDLRAMREDNARAFSEIVPRGEHEKVWQYESARNTRLEDRMSNLEEHTIKRPEYEAEVQNLNNYITSTSDRLKDAHNRINNLLSQQLQETNAQLNSLRDQMSAVRSQQIDHLQQRLESRERKDDSSGTGNH